MVSELQCKDSNNTYQVCIRHWRNMILPGPAGLSRYIYLVDGCHHQKISTVLSLLIARGPPKRLFYTFHQRAHTGRREYIPNQRERVVFKSRVSRPVLLLLLFYFIFYVTDERILACLPLPCLHARRVIAGPSESTRPRSGRLWCRGRGLPTCAKDQGTYLCAKGRGTYRWATSRRTGCAKDRGTCRCARGRRTCRCAKGRGTCLCAKGRGTRSGAWSRSRR